MAKDELERLQTVVLRLKDRFSRMPAPPMLNVGEKQCLRELHDELGGRTEAVLAYAFRNWQRIRRRYGEDLGEHTMPADPRLEIVLEFLSEISGECHSPPRMSAQEVTPAQLAAEAQMGSGPGTSFIVESGAPSVDEVAAAAAGALRGS